MQTEANNPTFILAIDPGTKESAYVEYYCNRKEVVRKGKLPNQELAVMLDSSEILRSNTTLVIEMVKSYGSPIGDSVLETCVWIGRFIAHWHYKHRRIARPTILAWICKASRGNDSMIRQALIDRFGGDEAIGTKKNPGPLYGVKGDIWSALAVAVAYTEMIDEEKRGVKTPLTTTLQKAKEVWDDTIIF